MVINQIDVGHVAFLETKNDPPVGPDGDAPEAGEVAPERMQSEPRKVHVLRPRRAVQKREDTGDLIDVLCIQSAPVVVRIKGAADRDGESGESFIPECKVTIIACQEPLAHGSGAGVVREGSIHGRSPHLNQREV
jgi:hypothetical protein